MLSYEGEQHRYFHDVVGDMNLMKVIKTLESWGIDLQKIAKENGLSLGNLFARVSDTRRMPKKGTIFDLIPDINKTLSAVDLTTDNLDEMCKDSGITDKDILEAFGYIIGLKTSRAQEAEQNIEAPLYLLRSYERQLAEFFLLGGYDVSYGNWGN